MGLDEAGGNDAFVGAGDTGTEEPGKGGDHGEIDVFTVGDSWAIFLAPVTDTKKPYSIPFGEGNVWFNRILSLGPHLNTVSAQSYKFISYVSRSDICVKPGQPVVNESVMLNVAQAVFVQPMQQLIVPCVMVWANNVQQGEDCLYYTLCLWARSLGSSLTVVSPLYAERARQWKTKEVLLSKIVVNDDRMYLFGTYMHPFECAKLFAQTFGQEVCVAYFKGKEVSAVVLFCVEPSDRLLHYIYSDDFGQNLQVTGTQNCGIRVIKNKYALDRILRYNDIISDTVLSRVPPGVHITHHNLRLQKGGQFTGQTNVGFGPPTS